MSKDKKPAPHKPPKPPKPPTMEERVAAAETKLESIHRLLSNVQATVLNVAKKLGA